MKTILFSLIFVLMLSVSFSRSVWSDTAYLGQTSPGNKPQIFAPGIISLNNRFETYPTFSPDGKEMFFSVVNSAWTAGKILHTRELNGTWTAVDTADFSANAYINWESFISPDGNRQFFTSNRPPSLGTDIWMIERNSDSTWTSPVCLPGPVNSGSVDGSACITNNGTLYFKSPRGGGTGGSVLYRSKLAGGGYPQIESLGNTIPTGPGESEPFMALDESYLIFISETRVGGHGGWDLWITFRKPDSSYTTPVNMGADVNTTNDEYGPRVTSDGKYLFFTRENRGNTMDIYWVSSGIIDSLKSTVLSTPIPLDSLYLGQTPPGDSAILFAPGKISLPNRKETKIVFSPDNKECLISTGQNNTFKILYTDFYSGYWKTPVPAYFISNPRPIEPFYSPDSLHVFLTSNADIFMSSSVNKSWATPINLGSPVNTGTEEYHPTAALNGTLYFCSMRENASSYLYRSRPVNGNYSTVEKLDAVINRHDSTQNGAYDPFIAPDESYLIFSSIRSGGFGQDDQYISYNRNGRWTNPKNLGPTINSSAIEYGSYVSPDTKYYFFSRPAGWGPNAAADIYWIKIDGLIDSLSHTNFSPYLNKTINNQVDSVGHSFNFIIPDSAFIDDDGNNSLAYHAKLSNGRSLPAWLKFDTISGTFTGIPSIIETLDIRVTATDPTGASAAATFSLEILKSNSIERIDMKGVKIFPNPSSGVMNVLLERLPGVFAIIEVSDMEGKVILKDKFQNNIRLDLTSIPKGIYVIKLSVDNDAYTCKFCLE
ncbi:MAG: putative Ig domain-containing protein [Bacteroidota bacterium]